MDCSKCKCQYDLQCINISSESFTKFTASYRKSWLCPSCVCLLPKRGNINTPVRSPDLNTEESLCDNINVVRGSRGKITATSDITLLELVTEIRELREEIKELKQTNNDMCILRQDVLELKEHLASLSPSISQHFIDFKAVIEDKNKEINDLKLSVSQLQSAVSALETNALRNEIEICGMPEERNENLTHLLLTVSQKINVNLQESDIDSILRTGAKHNSKEKPNQHRPIIVKLTRKIKRDEILSAAKSRRNVTSEDMVHGTKSKIYINERVTKEKRLLFREARARAQRNGFRFCWLRNGIIYIKKFEDNDNNRYPAIRIQSFEDLDKHVGISPATLPSCEPLN
ncbi:hypothetical protein PYW07_013374 [Mythimna separata]|uniref:FP protein C-terminal domain-containing protein n=1 Tax=Mythimna separata TaxID=271217 RepID=A0AAD8DKF4_MYTSE|nr:hypothetical protein PYW07_013374 [Mythimna separata]